MKKILYFVWLSLFSYISKAQLNYNFSTATGTFTLLSGDVVAPLVAAYSPTKSLLDESFANDIPLGFNFQYNGINYTTIHLNVNGFASLGTPFLSSITDPTYEVNELRSFSGLKATIRPILAPLWDNLLVNSDNDITYKTSGTAPNRVFISQWKNMIWQDGTSAISFQLKLYEITNIVEFTYRSEAGSGLIAKSASIGITSENTQMVLADHDSTNFIALINASPKAIIDRIKETETINVKPRTGQIFRFTPKICMPPSGIILQDYSTSTATIKWTPTQGTSNYEYAISNIDVQPLAGTVSNLTSLTFNNLAPNTDYFFFIKNACGNIWKKLSFKTTILAVLPYNESFEDAFDKSLPSNMTAANNSNVFADIFWQTTDLLPPATGMKMAINGSPFTTSKSWLFTPSFNFIAGRTYELTYKISATGSAGTMSVKYGRKAGESAMVEAIGTNSTISNTSYSTKTFTFSPTNSGEHTLGFGYESGINNQLILLDDIALKLLPSAVQSIASERTINAESKEEELVVILYPNPSEKEVFLKVKKPLETTIKVFTMNGSELSITSQVMNDTEIKIIPNQPINQGIYLVNIITDNETRILKWMVY